MTNPVGRPEGKKPKQGKGSGRPGKAGGGPGSYVKKGEKRYYGAFVPDPGVSQEENDKRHLEEINLQMQVLKDKAEWHNSRLEVLNEEAESILQEARGIAKRYGWEL